MRRVNVLLIGKTPVLVSRPWGKRKPPEASPNRPGPDREAESFLVRDAEGRPAVESGDLLAAFQNGLESVCEGERKRVRLTDLVHEIVEPNGFAPLLRPDGQPLRVRPEIVPVEADDNLDVLESEMLVVRTGREDIQGTVALPRADDWALRLVFLYDETRVEPRKFREILAEALRRAGDFGLGAFSPRDRRGIYGRFYPAEWREEVVAETEAPSDTTAFGEAAA